MDRTRDGAGPLGGVPPIDTRTAYDRYLRATELHELQAPLSGTEGEWSFLVVCQIQELYFSLIGRELDTARGHCDSDDVAAATAALRRAAGHFAGLNASWRSLSFMTPRDFQPIKAAMGATYGRSSSVQSWTFRGMAYLLGIKDADMAMPLQGAGSRHAELLALLASPSVYDAALGILARRGYPVPGEYAAPGVARPATERWSRPEVERAWGLVYDADAPDLAGLADALFGVAEGYADYEHHHLMATRRTLGHRTGYYGVPGVDWLRTAVEDLPFPELWTLRVPGE